MGSVRRKRGYSNSPALLNQLRTSKFINILLTNSYKKFCSFFYCTLDGKVTKAEATLDKKALKAAKAEAGAKK
jgi:hypothetical protein